VTTNIDPIYFGLYNNHHSDIPTFTSHSLIISTVCAIVCPMSETERSAPDVVITSSYRRPTHREQVFQAAQAITDSGRSSYPPPTRQETVISNDFVLLEGTNDPETARRGLWQIERGFLEDEKRAKIVYGVVAKGYDGHSAAVEKAYALANGKQVVLSELITLFGKDVPDAIREILLSRQESIPIMPVDQINQSSLENVMNQNPTYKPLSEVEIKSVLSAVRGLAREHQPPKVEPGNDKFTFDLDWAKESALHVYNAIVGPLNRYPDEFDEEDEIGIKKVAQQMARVAYLEGIGALAENPLPDLVNTLLAFHEERSEEGERDDYRFLVAADNIVEAHHRLHDIATAAVIGPDGRSIDQGQKLLDLFSHEDESDKPYEGVPLVTFDESEEILANRLLHNVGIKRQFSFERTFGYVKERERRNTQPFVVVNGIQSLPTKYDGITAWIQIDPNDTSKFEVGLSFDYRIKRILSNIRVNNVGLESV
jgi:hypothetical protein